VSVVMSTAAGSASLLFVLTSTISLKMPNIAALGRMGQGLGVSI
jgi:hypothetical protein